MRTIDIKTARESYNVEINFDAIWIRRNFNIADAMAKTDKMEKLLKTLTNRKLRNEFDKFIIEAKKKKATKEKKRASVRKKIFKSITSDLVILIILVL